MTWAFQYYEFYIIQDISNFKWEEFAKSFKRLCIAHLKLLSIKQRYMTISPYIYIQILWREIQLNVHSPHWSGCSRQEAHCPTTARPVLPRVLPKLPLCLECGFVAYLHQWHTAQATSRTPSGGRFSFTIKYQCFLLFCYEWKY